MFGRILVKKVFFSLTRVSKNPTAECPCALILPPALRPSIIGNLHLNVTIRRAIIYRRLEMITGSLVCAFTPRMSQMGAVDTKKN